MSASDHDAPSISSPTRALLLLAVLLTGATSLAYEVAWTRGLVLVLGSTATTTAVVLAMFVGALGLGARWGGRRADEHARPLRLYGLLEMGAALWAVVALQLAGLLLQPYAAVAGWLPEVFRFPLRVGCAALVVAPGAFLLGATLPALVRFWTAGGGEAGRGTAWVYGVNTIGAVAGTLLTGFYGIEAFGVWPWLALAACVAAAVGTVAVYAGSRGDGLAKPASLLTPTPEVRRLPLGPALGAAAICGAVGLGLEVAGFRILVFFVEGFTATFAAMLGVFIAGLGLGSLLLGPWLTRSRRPDRVLGILLVVVALPLFLCLWVVIPGLESLVAGVKDSAYASAADESDVQAALRLTALVGSGALLFVPAFLLGATFPLCVRWAELSGLSAGRAVGRVYLWNSVGTVVAPFLVGFVLIPLLGVPDAWRFLTMLCAFAGMALTCHVDAMPRRPGLVRAVWVVTAVVLAIHIALPVVTGGPDSSARLVAASHVMRGHPERELLDVRTDAVTTASVVETRDGERILYTDEFAAAATGRHYRYMRMLGHLPVLFARQPKNVMVIAFGTGTTAGAVARHEEVETLEVVEVSSAVFDLAPYFHEANRGVLEDPDLHVVKVKDDGRNALLVHEANLDVITLEPLMPYSPAGLPFYTREFYELARDRLRDGGVLCQWVPVHAMPAGLYAALVRTFFEVFPKGSLWFFEQSSALIAVKGTGADHATFERRAHAVAEDLREAGFSSPYLVLSAFVASGRYVLHKPVPDSAFKDRTVRDLDPFPEFHPTPRASLNTPYLRNTLDYIWTLAKNPEAPPYLDPDADTHRLREGTRWGLSARVAEAVAQGLAIEKADPRIRLEALSIAEQEYAQACQALPGERVLAWRHARVARRAARLQVSGLLASAREARAQEREAEAQDILRGALAIAKGALDIEEQDPVAAERGPALWFTAVVYVHMGRCASAKGLLEGGAVALPLGSEGRDLVQDGLRAIADHAAGEGPPEDPTLARWLEGAPACRAEGAALIEAPLARWREVVAAGGVRSLRLAADNLVVAARREGVEAEARAVLLEAGAPERAEARAVWAGALVRLDAENDPFEAALVHESGALRQAALREAGRLHRLGRHRAAVLVFAAAEDASLREAYAEAAGEDGDPALVRRIVDLLMDDVRSVRLAAATALLRHAALETRDYDPDADEAARRKAADRIREALPD